MDHRLFRNYIVLFVFLFLAMESSANPLPIDRSRMRDIESWKPAIADYSHRHYGEYTHKLDPTCIVLHYTVSDGFPWNLVDTQSFAGETPGLGVHYVVDGNKVWELIPPNIRSRGCYGINHRAINIEMVAWDASDLAQRSTTLKTAAQLTRYLQERFYISTDKIYSHEDVSKMNPNLVPEVKDLIDPTPYGKIDPGEQNMRTIKRLLDH